MRKETGRDRKKDGKKAGRKPERIGKATEIDEKGEGVKRGTRKRMRKDAGIAGDMNE